MNVNFPEMPAMTSFLLPYDVNTNLVSHVSGVQSKDNAECLWQTSVASQSRSDVTNLAPISNAGTALNQGAYAHDGCWYPYAYPIGTSQLPLNLTWNVVNGNVASSSYPDLQTIVVPNCKLQVAVPPHNLCEVPQNGVQMPSPHSTLIQNSARYFWPPQNCNEVTVLYRCDFGAAMQNSTENYSEKNSTQYLGTGSTVLNKEPIKQPCVPTNAVMLAPPREPGKTSQLATAPCNEQCSTLNTPHLRNVPSFSISTIIELLYGPLNGKYAPNGRPTLLTPYASMRSPGLELVWKKHFALLFGSLEGQWFLSPTQSPLCKGFTLFRDMAKVRFSCQFCQRGWTSMFGVVLFFYRWNSAKKLGEVHFFLMGQVCSRCKEKNYFEIPMWYPEEAQKVMTNLFYEICARVFGQRVPPFNRDRRHGRPRQEHNSEQCQGCVLQLCKPQKIIPLPEASEDETVMMPQPAIAENLYDREGHSVSLSGLSKRVESLKLPVTNDGELSNTETDEDSKRENQTHDDEVHTGNFWKDKKVVKIESPVESGVPGSNYDSENNVQRDQRVILAIAKVRESLSKRS